MIILIEKLRAAAKTEPGVMGPALFNEAANEITHLRTLNAVLVEALEKIIGLNDPDTTRPYMQAYSIARAALALAKGDGA